MFPSIGEPWFPQPTSAIETTQDTSHQLFQTLCLKGICPASPYTGPFLKTLVPTDVDECSSGASCGRHGHCTNTEGSFRCSCAPGYRVPPGQPGPCAGEQSGARPREPGSVFWVSG